MLWVYLCLNLAAVVTYTVMWMSESNLSIFVLPTLYEWWYAIIKRRVPAVVITVLFGLLLLPAIMLWFVVTIPLMTLTMFVYLASIWPINKI